MTTKKRSTRTPSTRSRKRPTTPDSEPEVFEQPAPSPGPIIATVGPEPSFAGRVAPPPPPRPRPDQRRGIFFDVENTSRPQDIEQVLRHLMIDRIGIETDFTAVGNWRVIGHETARLLAERGAHLVHSAPSVGVRDWSDLRIAVASGVWLAAARPGDMIDIVSDDQAFDAVGDVAASLGVQYRRLSYRAIAGRTHVAESTESAAPSRGGRRRGRRGRRGGEPRHHGEAPRRHEPEPHRELRVVPAAEVGENGEAHTAPHDELIEVVRGLLATSPAGVTLDQLANALREHGFRRTPGSPRLITRLKRIKEIQVSRSGLISIADGGDVPGHQGVPTMSIEPPDADRAEGESDADAEVAAEGTAAPAEGGGRRRRRRRGGRRRRGRRGGSGSGNGDAAGEVVAAAAPAFSTES